MSRRAASATVEAACGLHLTGLLGGKLLRFRFCVRDWCPQRARRLRGSTRSAKARSVSGGDARRACRARDNAVSGAELPAPAAAEDAV